MYSYKNTRIYICIDKSENGIISGRVACPLLSSPKKFCDVCNMLLQTEAVLDTIGCPYAFQRLRTFSNKNPEVAIPETVKQNEMPITEHAPGALYTVCLRIDSRQNASWQGVATLKNGEVFPFKSALQLLKRIRQIYEAGFES